MITPLFSETDRMLLDAVERKNYGFFSGGNGPFWKYHESYQGEIDRLVVLGAVRDLTPGKLAELAPLISERDSLNWTGYYTPEFFELVLERLVWHEERARRELRPYMVAS